ncbi:MAG TPA: Ig-like domain-containing protein [Thermoanaerobaculia bacterium]|nr:Ig-like domain-containing protein [Thermoanaerobaculia bacterium]
MVRPRPVRALALVLSALLLTSCFSTQAVGRRPSAGRGGGVAVQVFPDDEARQAGLALSGGIVGELERQEGSYWVPVFRSLDARWTVLGLKPGTYRVRFPARLDDSGNEVPLDARPKIVRVRADQVTEVETVVEHVPPALVAAGVATAVVAAVLLWDWLDDHNLPTPPLPPPPPAVVEAVFQVAVEVAIASEGHGPTIEGVPPFVTSHFPEDGDWVAARRVRVTFALSEPIDPKEIDPEAVIVEGERSGLVPGRVSYDPSHWWIVWEPLDDLPRDDVFEATLAPGSVEDLVGMELENPETFHFRTTR